jgi:hypothetical protein
LDSTPSCVICYGMIFQVPFWRTGSDLPCVLPTPFTCAHMFEEKSFPVERFSLETGVDSGARRVVYLTLNTERRIPANATVEFHRRSQSTSFGFFHLFPSCILCKNGSQTPSLSPSTFSPNNQPPQYYSSSRPHRVPSSSSLSCSLQTPSPNIRFWTLCSNPFLMDILVPPSLPKKTRSAPAFFACLSRTQCALPFNRIATLPTLIRFHFPHPRTFTYDLMPATLFYAQPITSLSDSSSPILARG